MTDNWGFYERRSASEHMRVLINIGYKGAYPLRDYGELLSITINLYPVRANNRTNRNFIKELEQLESKLEDWLNKTSDAIYIGRINAARRLEFYYFLDSSRLTDQELNGWLERNWPYRAQVYRKPDPEWSFYTFMLPDALEELFIHNAQMIYALIHKGDDIGQPRNVYHWLLFREDVDRREIAPMLEKRGYVIEKEREGRPDQSHPYPLVVSRFEDVRLDTVNERVREIHGLIEGSGARYDGWGSVMKLSAFNRMRRSVKRSLGSVEAAVRRLLPRRNA